MKTHVLSSTLLAAGLVLALPGAALAQAGLPSKGSPEHIRAVTSRIDSQSIRDNARSSKAVSYTHLTLPTIYSV